MAKSFNARMRDRFATITTNGDKLNLYIHETAMMIANHAKEHGDCSTAQGLVMSMPASMRREMLILWFATFTPIVVKNDDKWAAQMHKPNTKLFVDWNLDDGEATPFYRLAEEHKEKAPLDAEKALALILQMAKRMTKQADEGKVKPEDVDYIRAISSALSGLKVNRPKPANDTTVAVAKPARKTRAKKTTDDAKAAA